jgi:hypothetical protein
VSRPASSQMSPTSRRMASCTTVWSAATLTPASGNYADVTAQQEEAHMILQGTRRANASSLMISMTRSV